MRKFFEFNSIRSRMVGGFLFLTILLMVLALVSISIFDRITLISRTHGKIGQLEVYTLSLMKSDNDFFDLETINENYFRTHKSDFLRKRDSLNNLISVNLNHLLKQEKKETFGIEESLLSIDTTLAQYNRKFNRLEELIFKKGFKDYGVEGAMRFHAHAAEERMANRNMLDLLFLRRHEKDFLLRNDTSYLTAFKNRTRQLLNDLPNQSLANATLIGHLHEYRRLFFELAAIQKELGLSSKHGLRNELNQLTNSLSDQYYSLSEYSLTYTESMYKKVRILYIALLLGAVIFSIVSGYWISRRLSEPIARLARIIQGAIASGNTIRIDLNMLKAAIEIRTLGNSFNQLMARVNAQMDIVTVKNNELVKTNRELDNFLYSTAHDLRSPLTSMLGLLNIMRRVNKQEDLKEYIVFMEKSVQRSENFISQIVNFSQNKKMDIVREEIDLNQIISGIFESHQFIEGASKIEKIVSVEADQPFYSDRNRVIMILTNLISNGIKYADLQKPNPYIKINIVVRHDDAEIEFIDNGLGIEKLHIDNIFDMFYRANVNSTGSGLGLFIFKETLARLGGHATVDSTFGKGTKFFIRIPNLKEAAHTQHTLSLQD